VERIVEVFAKYFEQWDITLPKENLNNRSDGKIQAEGWTIKYLFDRDQRGEYMDFYATHRMTNDRHVRIRDDGQTQLLPSFMEFTVYSEDASSEERMQAEREYHEHNNHVEELLRKKGFI
jgi:hypothetical protein